MKAQLYYLNKRTQQEERVFDQLYRDAKFVTRANDPSKTLGNKVVRFLLATIVEMLMRDREKTTFIDHEFISSITDCKPEQNRNLLSQLADIIDFKYHRSVNFRGKRRLYGYIIKFTHDGQKRVEEPQKFYGFKVLKKSVTSPKKLEENPQKIRASTIYKDTSKISQEEEDSPYRAISSSFQDHTRIENTTPAHMHAHEEPTPKPRYRVAAISVKISKPTQEQSIASLSCDAASSLCSTEETKQELVKPKPRIAVRADFSVSNRQETLEVSRTSNSHNAATPSKPLTSSQEREYYRNHRSRSIESDNGFIPTAEIFNITNLQQQDNAMKAYDWDNPAKKLDLAIIKNFDSDTAQKLTASIDYRYFEHERKMRLVFKQKLKISEHNKNLLKQLIKGIYGDNTEVVTTTENAQKADVVKIARSQEKFSNTTRKVAISNLETTSFGKQQPPEMQETEEVFERFIPTDENELLKLADEIREKSCERAVNKDDDAFGFNARIEQLLATDSQIFRI